jgi:hypothetical protein
VATPQTVAEEALAAVRQMKLPAYNWPGITNKDQLQKELNNHHNAAAVKVGLLKEEPWWKKLNPFASTPEHVMLPQPSLKQAVDIGEYFATGQCPVLNCGDRTTIALALAKKYSLTVGAVHLRASNHEFMLLTSTRDFFKSHKTNFLLADENKIEGSCDVWFCDPWYWRPGCQSAAEAGVAYPIADWPKWGPDILRAANCTKPWECQIIIGLLPGDK